MYRRGMQDSVACITQDERGLYHWTGTIDRAYEGKTCKITFGVCGGICLFIILMSLLLGSEMLWVVLLSCAGVMAVAALTCGLFSLNAGKRTQRYMMSEEGVYFHQRRYEALFPFKSIKKAVVYPERSMSELYQKVGSGPVFVPPEEFDFVKRFILERLPDGTEVICR